MAKDVKQAHETEVFRAFIEAGRSDHQGGGVWFHVEPVAVALLKAHKAGVNAFTIRLGLERQLQAVEALDAAMPPACPGILKRDPWGQHSPSRECS
jgi:hypothetical protein